MRPSVAVARDVTRASALRTVCRVKWRRRRRPLCWPSESSTPMSSATTLTSNDTVRLVLDTVEARNPHEPEFLQAVHEVLESIAPVLDTHPEFVDGGILERIVEPER